MSTIQPAERDRVDTHRTEPEHRGRTPRSSRDSRIALGVLGGALVVAGLRRRSGGGTLLAIVGGLLLSSALGVTARLRRAVAVPEFPTDRGGDRAVGAEGVRLTRSITVGKSPDELYELWRDPDHLSDVMRHFAHVTSRGSDRLRWIVDGPGGREVSWETRFVEEAPGELLRWESPADATVPNEGTVRFRPAAGDRGTIVTLTLDFEPPAGSLGTATLERLDVVPESFVGVALDRFKCLAETGEIPTLQKNPSARGQGDLL